METLELKQLIKESLKEVIKEERLALYEILVHDISEEEFKEIKKRYRNPKEYHEDEFVDMTGWVKN